MTSVPFVTCDLLDDNPEKAIQTLIPSLDGKFFKSYGARKTFGGQIVTVKCFEDNSAPCEIWHHFVITSVLKTFTIELKKEYFKEDFP